MVPEGPMRLDAPQMPAETQISECQSQIEFPFDIRKHNTNKKLHLYSQRKISVGNAAWVYGQL